MAAMLHMAFSSPFSQIKIVAATVNQVTILQIWKGFDKMLPQVHINKASVDATTNF